MQPLMARVNGGTSRIRSANDAADASPETGEQTGIGRPYLETRTSCQWRRVWALAYRREGNLFLVMSSSGCRRAADDRGLFPRKGKTERDWMPDGLVSALGCDGERSPEHRRCQHTQELASVPSASSRGGGSRVTGRLRIRVQGFIRWSPKGWSNTHGIRSSFGKTDDVGGATKALAWLVWIRLT